MRGRHRRRRPSRNASYSRAAAASRLLVWVASVAAAAALFTARPATIGRRPLRAAVGACGMPVSAGTTPTASDALFTLRVAVGLESCPNSVCDVDADCRVTASDALRILRRAVGLPDPFDCAGACTTTVPVTTTTVVAPTTSTSAMAPTTSSSSTSSSLGSTTTSFTTTTSSTTTTLPALRREAVEHEAAERADRGSPAARRGLVEHGTRRLRRAFRQARARGASGAAIPARPLVVVCGPAAGTPERATNRTLERSNMKGPKRASS